MRLLAVSNRRQQQRADCLAACAATVLDYLGLAVSYERLLRALHIQAIGAPFPNLRNLESLNLLVVVGEGDMEIIRTYLDGGTPVIVAVDVQHLPYWSEGKLAGSESVRHALVVVGIDESSVYVNDPAFDDAPQAVELAWFELAWLEKDYRYGVIKRKAKD